LRPIARGDPKKSDYGAVPTSCVMRRRKVGLKARESQ